MKALYDLKDKLNMELEEIARKGELSAGDLETVHKLTDTVKNIDKICMLEEEGYSNDGDWEAEMRGSYGRGNSYANRGKHYVRGHYSRDGYSKSGSQRGYSRDSYSRNYSQAKGDMIEQLEEMMHDAGSEQERETLRRCMADLQKV